MVERERGRERVWNERKVSVGGFEASDRDRSRRNEGDEKSSFKNS